MKSYRIYLLFIAILFTAFVAVEYVKPKPISWEETYINKDKIPYGTYVLYEMLKDVFPGVNAQSTRLPVYNKLETLYSLFENNDGELYQEAKSKQRFNYLFINPTFRLDTMDLKFMFRFVFDGSAVFIASHDIDKLLLDSLHLKLKYDASIKNDSIKINYVNTSLQKEYRVKQSNAPFTFQQKDSLSNYKMEVLAATNSGNATFVRITYGDGNFYLCSTPTLFSNYALLSADNGDFAYKALSYLPVNEVYWDEYQKQGRAGDDSIWRAVFASEPLRWAYYISLASIFIFVVFEARRRQRIIPVITPLSNSTLEFTRTIGNLYLSKGDHKNIASKKMNYFLEFIRERYRLQTTEWTDDLLNTISLKSGVDKLVIDDIFRMINFIKFNTTISEKNLLDFNLLLEKFYRAAA